MNSKYFLSWLLLAMFLPVALFAQPGTQMIKVIVAPDHADWTYRVGEKAKFTVTVLQNGNPLKNVGLKYEVGPEMLEAVIKDSMAFTKESLTINGGTMKAPGFLRCIVTVSYEGKNYRGLATAGFDPHLIKPTVGDPADFDAFWTSPKTELAQTPLDARMTLMPERCTEKVNVYHLNLQGYKSSRVYGILCVPKAEGKYPAILRVPGAGIRPYNGDVATAEKGFITLEIGIHGIPVNLDPAVYNNLMAGGLANYWNVNLDDKDRYYYKRVYVNCVRANDFLVSMTQYDGKNLGVTGGSQGGALSIVTAALDPRVKYLSAFYPALSDLTGYLQGRAGGWPHLFGKANNAYNNTKDKVATVGYYDVVNFAKRVKVPGIYSMGYNDDVCPPTSMYASYNVITAPKEMYLVQETGHWTYPEQQEKLGKALQKALSGQR